MINPYIILAVVVAFVASGFYWFYAGEEKANLEWTAKMDKARANAEAEARAKEQWWQANTNAINDRGYNEQKRLISQRDTALASVQSRVERAAGEAAAAARATCRDVGATGSELSKPDSEFLIGEATRCDGAVNTLTQLQDYVKVIRSE